MLLFEVLHCASDKPVQISIPWGSIGYLSISGSPKKLRKNLQKSWKTICNIKVFRSLDIKGPTTG